MCGTPTRYTCNCTLKEVVAGLSVILDCIAMDLCMYNNRQFMHFLYCEAHRRVIGVLQHSRHLVSKLGRQCRRDWKGYGIECRHFVCDSRRGTVPYSCSKLNGFDTEHQLKDTSVCL